jgi:kumamolisin
MEKAIGAFKKAGLSVAEASAATRSLRLVGTAASMEQAFGVRLFRYSHARGDYRGRVGAIHVPHAIKDLVEGVFGLDNRRVVRRRRQPAHGRPRQSRAEAIPGSWYTPARLGKHYHFPGGDGAGQSVGILEFGGGYFESDLETFCQMTGTGVPAVKTVSADGSPTDVQDDATGEVMLDVEVVAGICPKSTIVLYFAHFSEHGWIRALDAVLQDKANNPGVVSVSWGWAEDDPTTWTHQALRQINDAFHEAALLGLTICAAAGDDGSSDAIGDGHAHVDFPASSPYVLAVGGTTITSDSKDIVWKEGSGLRDEGGGSTGGGVSTIFDRPAWQSALTIETVNPAGKVGRCVPDAAANADWDASPYLLVVGGASQPNGGTSAAAPLWAALVSLLNQKRGDGKRLGFLAPLLYQQTSGQKTIGQTGCTDVKSGDNTTDPLGGYKAESGYDACTGWGTPNGEALQAALDKI